MSKRAREFRATTRRDDRYVEGREKLDDREAAVHGWNKAETRKLRKFERRAGELLMTTDQYYDWIIFNYRPWSPLLKNGRKP